MDKNNFLKLMSLMESSGGKNIQHQPITTGLQAGSTAYGQFGLMPNTVKEMAKRRKSNGSADDNDQQIINSDNDGITNTLQQHPELEQRYAQDLAQKALDKSNGDVVDAAYRWRWGQNLPQERIDEIKKKNPDYFNRLQNFMNTTPNELSDNSEDAK
jgi:hypothetical protein